MFQESAFGGQVAIVTGASRGLGHAVAGSIWLARAHVVLTDIDGESFGQGREGTAEVRASRRRPNQLDVSDPGQVENLFGVIDNELGRVDILVNNAGTLRRKLLVEHSVEDWRTQMAVNLDGTFFCSKAAVELMRRSGEGRSSTSQRSPPSTTRWSRRPGQRSADVRPVDRDLSCFLV